jgi:signal transduction histidine kinase
LAYYLNLKNKSQLSKLILITAILTLNFIAGVNWGFDLPSILLSYVFCIVILALTSKVKENIIYNTVLIISIFIGYYLRQYLNIEKSWYTSGFYINDIIEFSIIFICISFLLIKFNTEQNKTLNRALRVENILRKERDDLEKIVLEKTKEIKQIQIEEVSKMYHLIEFGKLSSGLYHDLITPIQTMNLYIEKLTEEHLVDDSKFSKVILNIKNTHEKLTIMLQNIRKQIGLKIEDEEFDLKEEIVDLINLVKNNYFKNNININIYSENFASKKLTTKKSILNHIVLNLISNAYEACVQDN